MPCCGPESEIETRKYPSGNNAGLRIAGYILIGLGVVLILICVPLRAWLALLGAALVLLGLLLIRK